MLALLLLVLGLSSAPARAQEPLRVGLTVSGGVSLGTYEAGYLYMISEALRRSVPDTELIISTGASAGSINSLATAVASCLPPQDDPTQDLGYRLWVDIGLDGLLDQDRATAVSMLHRDRIEERWGQVEEQWRQGLPEDCEVMVGAPVTRFHGAELPMDSRLHLSRQTLYFAVRIQGRGPGQPPRISNVVDHRARVPQVLVPLGETPETAMEDLERIRDVLLASAAFPLAFEPVSLDYCVVEPEELWRTDEDLRCTEPEQTALFIDGGVYDNQPLDLNSRLVQDIPGVRQIYVDPGIRAWPIPSSTSSEPPPTDFTSLLGGFAGGFITSAMNSRLYSVAETRPEVLDELLVGTNRFPPASGHLQDFLGFFDRAFREFDFALGMYDAWSDLGEWGLVEEEARLSLLEDPGQSEAWGPFTCLVSVYDTDLPAESCFADDMLDFRILAQASLDHVYSDCRQTSEPTSHRHCELARQGALPPALVDSPYEDPAQALRRPDETRVDHHLRLLADHHFHYADLGLPRARSQRGTLAVARSLEDMITAMGNQQPDPIQRGLLQLVGRVFSGEVAYQAPAHWTYVTTGSMMELGASLQPSQYAPWLRVNPALQLDGFLSLFSKVRSDVALRAAVGPEVEILPLSSSIVVPTVALRGGYQLGGGDDFHLQTCGPVLASNDARNCSQPMAQIVVAGTLVERIRAQVEVDWFGHSMDFDHRRFDLEISMGVQF